MSTLLPSPMLQFIDANGHPYAAGSVYTYLPGTTTPATTWKNAAQTVQNTNPISLDMAGRCIAYGTGSYRFVVQDNLGNTVFDQVTSDTSTTIGNGSVSGNLTVGGNLVVTGTYPGSSYTAPVAGAASRSITSKVTETAIAITDFPGADPTGATYSDAAFALWIAAGQSTGIPLFLPAGTFKLASATSIDVGASAAANGALRISGVLNRSILDLTAVSAAPSLYITDSAGAEAAFYGAFENITIKGNCAGAVVQIGDNARVQAFNEYTFKLQVSNANTSTSAIATLINGVYNADFFNISNCAGHGNATVVTAAQFSRFFGSYGNADTALHITGGYVTGNVFLAMDLEVVNTCVVIDVNSAANNTFIGGQFVWSNGSGPSVAAINASAGNNNRFIGANFASPGSVCSGTVGVIIYGPSATGTEQFGNLLVKPVAGDGVFAADSPAGNVAAVQFRKAGLSRWGLTRNNTAETGSNIGSDFTLARFNDAGAAIDNPLSIARSTGVVSLSSAVIGQTGGAVGFYGTGAVAKQTLTGSRGGNVALAALINLLVTQGLIVDGTSA